MAYNLGFSNFLFWKEGNAYLNPASCAMSSVSSFAMSPSARCYPGSSDRFYNSFLKVKHFSQIFSVVIEVHLFIFDMCSKFSDELECVFYMLRIAEKPVKILRIAVVSASYS